MTALQRLRECNLEYDEQVELVEAAKSALRRSGTSSTTFIWRGEVLHYGLTDKGVYALADGCDSDESEWAIAMPDPNAPYADRDRIARMTDAELLHAIVWSPISIAYIDEVRRRDPRETK
jgi:hypothetical protein